MKIDIRREIHLAEMELVAVAIVAADRMGYVLPDRYLREARGMLESGDGHHYTFYRLWLLDGRMRRKILRMTRADGREEEYVMESRAILGGYIGFKLRLHIKRIKEKKDLEM